MVPANRKTVLILIVIALSAALMRYGYNSINPPEEEKGWYPGYWLEKWHILTPKEPEPPEPPKRPKWPKIFP